jgi:hypothetical protein
MTDPRWGLTSPGKQKNSLILGAGLGLGPVFSQLSSTTAVTLPRCGSLFGLDAAGKARSERRAERGQRAIGVTSVWGHLGRPAEVTPIAIMMEMILMMMNMMMNMMRMMRMTNNNAEMMRMRMRMMLMMRMMMMNMMDMMKEEGR